MSTKNYWDITETEIADMDELLCNFPKSLSEHGKRTAMVASMMAEYALEHHYEENIPLLPEAAYLCGTLHDIGMLLVPFLAATESEYEQHPVLGAKFLSRYGSTLFSDERERLMVIDAIRCHHEKPNGEGFPHGLKAKDIPLLAGVCAIADSFDHMVINERGEAMDLQSAAQYIEEQSGITFSETAAMFFRECFDMISDIYTKKYI